MPASASGREVSHDPACQVHPFTLLNSPACLLNACTYPDAPLVCAARPLNRFEAVSVPPAGLKQREMRMPEIGLKLDVAPEDFETLKMSELFRKPASTLERHATYFDTAENSLEKVGLSLRLYRSGTSLVQTIEATAPPAPVFARREWEMPVTSEEPVVDGSLLLASRLGSIAAHTLLPLFEVKVARQIWIMDENMSRIAVSLDRGDVIAEGRRLDVCELELELKDGDPTDLFRLARKIEAIVPVTVSVQSKVERGYRLLDAAPVAIKAEPIHLEAGDTAEHAFRMIAGSCFRHFRLNETILLHRKNAEEALHQVRVALRRLRSALSVFKAHLGDEAKQLSDAFRELAGLLGDARDLDVLVTNMASHMPNGKLQEARRTAREAALAALSSPQARTLMIDFNEWLQSGSCRRDSALSKPVVDFAVHALDRQCRKLKKSGKDLTALTDDERHRIRKDAKKLRYAAEFFRSLFNKKRGLRRFKRFSGAMVELQDHLGALNDLAAGSSIAEKYRLGDFGEPEKNCRPKDKAKRILSSQKALDDLLDAKKFWS